MTRIDRYIINGLSALLLAAFVGLAAWWAFGSPPRRIVAMSTNGLGITGVWYSDPELLGQSFKFWLVFTGALPAARLILRPFRLLALGARHGKASAPAAATTSEPHLTVAPNAAPSRRNQPEPPLKYHQS
jgi:hypothetical protein